MANAFFRRARPPRKTERKKKRGGKAAKNKEGKVVRNLGVDFACGRGLPARPVQNTRLKGILRRMPLIKRLRQAGANLTAIARCALVPALVFGSSVVGFPPSLLHAARAAVRTTFIKNEKGRSFDVDFGLSDPTIDPVWHACVKLVFAYCVALWNAWLPRGVVLRGFSGAMAAEDGNKQWKNVAGPFPALLATIRRMQWTALSPTKWVTHRGEVDLLETPPRAMQGLAGEACKLWLWRQAAEKNPSIAAAVLPTPFLDPLAPLLKKTGNAYGSEGWLTPLFAWCAASSVP